MASNLSKFGRMAYGFWLITHSIFVQFGYNFIYVSRSLVATSKAPKAWFWAGLGDLA